MQKPEQKTELKQTEKERKKEYERDVQILKSFKELLINRKQAAFNKEKLNVFVLFGKYVYDLCPIQYNSLFSVIKVANWNFIE